MDLEISLGSGSRIQTRENNREFIWKELVAYFEFGFGEVFYPHLSQGGVPKYGRKNDGRVNINNK